MDHFPPLAEVLFESTHGDQKVALLLQYVLDCLHKIFLYDTQRFLSKERADALMSPLLDQVSQSGLSHSGPGSLKGAVTFSAVDR